MTRPIIKLERELEKELWRLCEKYGFTDIGVTGTIDPAYYEKPRSGVAADAQKENRNDSRFFWRMWTLWT